MHKVYVFVDMSAASYGPLIIQAGADDSVTLKKKTVAELNHRCTVTVRLLIAAYKKCMHALETIGFLSYCLCSLAKHRTNEPLLYQVYMCHVHLPSSLNTTASLTKTTEIDYFTDTATRLSA